VRGQADIINIHSFLIIHSFCRSHALAVPAVLETSAPTEGIFMAHYSNLSIQSDWSASTSYILITSARPSLAFPYSLPPTSGE